MPTVGDVTTTHSSTAAVLRAPGDLHFEVRDVPARGDGEVLVAVRASGICGSDTAYYRGTAKYRPSGPLVMGHEAVGEVVEADAGSATPAGSRVAIIPGFSCGTCALCLSGRDNLCAQNRYLGSAAVTPHLDGSYQQYLVLPASHVLPLPDSVDDVTGALLEPLSVATHAVTFADVEGRRVLVTGGGPIGQLVALVARARGAASITLTDVSRRRADAAVAHGSDRGLTVDEAAEALAGERFDVAFEASGSMPALAFCLRTVEPARGAVVLVGHLPDGSGIPTGLLAASEARVTATQRFPGGLASALDAVVSGRVDPRWIAESVVEFDDLPDVFAHLDDLGPDDSPVKQVVLMPRVS